MAVLAFHNPRSGSGFASWLDIAKGQSGVYVFRTVWPRRVEYVGESHTGNLYKTVTRHFWSWSDRTRAKVPHYVVDPVFDVEVAIVLVPASRAIDKQNELIRKLKPARNAQNNPDGDEVPF